MSEQKWTGDDEQAYTAAHNAMALSRRWVAHLEAAPDDDEGASPSLYMSAAGELRQCAELVTRLIDRRHALKNPVRQFDPFTDRPEDPTTRGPEDG
ncbi:MAG: hypothetical protein O7F08_01860 [Deltaproteobacteria bacterium]|nr:hypothetical protein [Deltaproteobacteria bacterium]